MSARAIKALDLPCAKWRGLAYALVLLVSLAWLVTGCSSQHTNVDQFVGQPPSPVGVIGNSAIKFTPATFDFGSIAVGSSSADRTIEIHNRTTSNIQISSIVGLGASFTVVSHSCPVSPALFPAGTSCSAVVKFTPATGGAHTYALTVRYRMANEPGSDLLSTSAGLSGTGVSPLVFAGIDSISQVTTTSVRLNWTANANATAYYIFKILADGSQVFVAIHAPPSTSYDVGSLTPATAYTFHVRAADVFGNLDGNTNDQSATTRTLGSFTAIASPFAVNEGAVAETAALSCTDSYGSAATLSVLTQSDSASNCSITAAPEKVSCAPSIKTGHSNWTSTVSIGCQINGSNLTRSFTVQVADVNRAPALAAIGNQSVLVDQAISAVDASDGGDDADADLDALAYSCTFSGGGNAAGTACTSLPGTKSFNGGTGELSWTPSNASTVSDAVTSYAITITASDQQSSPLTGSKTFSVTVTPKTPLLSSVADQLFPSSTITQGSILTFDLNNIRDGAPGNDSAMTYACTFDRVIDGSVNAGLDCGLLPGSVALNASSGVFSWLTNTAAFGAYELRLTGTNAGGTGSSLIKVQVTETYNAAGMVAYWDAFFANGIGHGLNATTGAYGQTTNWKDLAASSTAKDGSLTGFIPSASTTYRDAILADFPAAYWRLDESPGAATATDLSVTARTTTYQGVPGLGTAGAIIGSTNTAVTLNGTSQHLEFTHMSLLSGHTMQAWIKTTSNASSPANSAVPGMTVIGDTRAAVYMTFGVDGGKVQYRHHTTSWQSVTGSTLVNDGHWHHIAVTHDQASGAVVLYVDGEYDGGGTVTYNTTFPGANTIGAGYGGVSPASFFNGSIDEVALHSVPLNAALIRSYFTKGSLTGWIGSSARSHPFALKLNGAADSVRIAGVNNNSSFSFETWIKPGSAVPSNSVILSNGETTASGTASETNLGMTLRQSNLEAGRVQLLLGTKSYSDEVLADNPRGYWRLGETTGTKARDVMGSREGTYVSGTLAQPGMHGEGDASFRSGSGGYMKVPDLGLTSGTVEMWIYQTDQGTVDQRLFSQMSGGGHGSIQVGSSGVFLWTAANWQSLAGAGTIGLNTWHHFVVVYSGTNATLYVDGVAKGTIASTFDFNGVEAGFGAQYSNTFGVNFIGRIDEAAVYSAQLSPARIQAHYYAGTKRMTCHSTAPLIGNTWSHLAGVFNASGTPTLTLYMNGVQACQASLAGATYQGSSVDMKIGSDPSGSNFWSGAISMLRAYFSAISGANVRSDYAAAHSHFPKADVLPVTGGLELWLKPDAILGKMDGSAVAVWPDSSPKANHATQANLATQPIYRASVVNGRPALQYSGAHCLTTGAGSALGDHTVFVVFKDNATLRGYERLVDKSYTDGLFLARESTNANSFGGGVREGGVPYGVWGSFTDNQTHILSSKRSGTSHVIYRNGTELTNNLVTNALTSTAAYGIGCYHDGSTLSQAYDGYLMEVIVYGSALSDADRALVESYLRAKYGI